MTTFALNRRRWLTGNFDDPLEQSTFAEIAVFIGDQTLTRAYDRRSGGERDSLQIPLYPFAFGLSENWWPLLHEPRRPNRISVMHSCHRVDGFLHGYVFPALEIWSGGSEVVVVETPRTEDLHSTIEFLPPPLEGAEFIPRAEVENALSDLVETTLARLEARSLASSNLRASWDRVRESLADPQESSYCALAGRLGWDPYNPELPDLSQIASGLSESLFGDICEAVAEGELTETTKWVQDKERLLRHAPAVPIADFGAPPAANLSRKAYDEGYGSARLLRNRLSLEPCKPRRVFDELFGGIFRAGRGFVSAPPSIEALTQRVDGTMRAEVVGGSARRNRFRAYHATYLAWYCRNGEEAAATIATTRRQQASRAFAAEMLAPAEELKERAGNTGLTYDDIERIAGEFICPQEVVIRQAQNHGILMRGVFQ